MSDDVRQTRRTRLSTSRWLLFSVGLVAALVVLTIVLVDVLANSTPGIATVVHEVTSIPSAVYNKIGVDSPVVQVSGFHTIANQSPLMFSSNGKNLPGFIYWGAEYCPYCAATRWAIIAALARFGTFGHLHYMKSSSTDPYPDTNTFTFFGSTYTSKYLVFRPYEVENRAGTVLELPPPSVTRLINRYNSGEAFPFLDIGNRVFLVGSPYNPQILQRKPWWTIAGDLQVTSNPATQAIVATANYITAAVCEANNEAPASVCDSTGVEAAAYALRKSMN